jgi:TonB family protein
MRPGASALAASLAISLSLAAPPFPLGVAEQGWTAAPSDWEARLRAIRRQLARGEWAKARGNAAGLVDAMVRWPRGVDDARLLAAAVTCRGIAEAAVGQEEDAAWSWIIAQNLDPALRERPVKGVGRAGEVFARHRLRGLGEPPPGIAALNASGPGWVPPVPIDTPAAQPPPGAPADVWVLRPLEVEIVVDQAGVVRSPVVVDPERRHVPGKIVHGLEALRRWRFRPALEAGPPVAWALQVDPFWPLPGTLYDLASQRELQPIHELALAGRWTETAAEARRALATAVEECPARDGAAGTCRIGPLGLLLALAASGLGDSEQAAWHGSVALAFSPLLVYAPLGIYGPPGRALAELPSACRDGEWEDCPATPLWRSVPGIALPRRLAGDFPRLPPSLAESGGDRVIVRTVIGTDGRPRDPAVLAGRHPRAGFLALEALSGWRFEPARRGGEPTAVVIELTVPFAPDAPPERVGSWRRRLETLEGTLRAGEWEAAAPLAGVLADEIAAAAGQGGSDLLAAATMGLALADAGRERTDDAVWNWHLAQNLAHELRWADLSVYGAAGELLAAHPLRRPGELAAGTPAEEGAEQEFGSLQRTAGDDPVYPESLRGQVPVIEVVLRAGRPESPLVLSAHPPAVVRAALRALRTWKFGDEPDRPAVRKLALRAPAPAGGPPLLPPASRFAELAELALGSGEPARAECYWDQVPDADRGRLGPSFDRLKIEPPPIAERWSLARPGELAAVLPLAETQRTEGAPGEGPALFEQWLLQQVVPPVKLYAPVPQYTDSARKALIQGVVIVQAIVDRKGDVRDAEILKGLPLGLDAATIEAVCSWKFRPAWLEGKPVDVYYNVTINFTLEARR